MSGRGSVLLRLYVIAQPADDAGEAPLDLQGRVERMRFIAGPINGQLLENLLLEVMEPCTRVRAAVAYASRDNLKLFKACQQHLRPLEFYGRYDHTVPVDPPVLKWFLDMASPNFDCRLVPDILHAKVIWWVGAGAYVGSANLSDRA